MGLMQINCPHCKKDGQYDELYRGKIVQCGNCLNDFTANDQPAAGKSPVVTGVQPRIRQQQQPPENCGMAIGAFVTGLLGIPFVGLILGIISMNKINASNGQLTGKWMAITGLVLSATQIVMIPVLAAILFPVFAKSREKAYQTTCVSNQRQIAVAVQMYAQDHEETLPSDKTMWTDIMLDQQMKTCPKVKNGEPSYGYNRGLSKVKYEFIPDASIMMLTADGGNSSNLLTSVQDMKFRHINNCAVSYADGHVEMVSKENMQPQKM